MVFIIWNEWFTVHQLQRHNIVPVEDPRPVQWEKPEAGWIKCNVDAAFVVIESDITFMGLCFRDTNEHFVAEALTLLHTMKEAIHRGFERVQFESDSKLLEKFNFNIVYG
ncbi:uncharacterized protein LOC123904493 [Trifolium pratense]|uniref:uncharacterized protein LOC123904493 n=1 Tax=Trifolium pratense TaxID=57577 RepID=UPI001E690152|nr:uncharacterized protein LOC123904493 [Trifolium pratense]